MPWLVLFLFIGGYLFPDAIDDQRHGAWIGFSYRWSQVGGEKKKFTMWKPTWTQEELRVQFDQLANDRWNLYFKNVKDKLQSPSKLKERKEYERPKDWGKNLSREFVYNIASQTFGGSIMTVGGRQFLAIAAPTDQTMPAFINLLTQYKVTDLVRLSPPAEKRETHPSYWENHLNISEKTGNLTIELGGREMNYYCTDGWNKSRELEPRRLIALVKQIMAHETPDQLVAVHCRAGIDRTGAFLVLYELICEIDSQYARGVSPSKIQVSVDKVIWKLSLQRSFMVSLFPKYVDIYQAVGAYLEMLQNSPSMRKARRLSNIDQENL